MHNLIFANTSALQPKDLKNRKTGIKNKNQFDSCLDKRKYQKQLDDDIKTAFNVGITFTPSYIIGKVVGNKFLEGEIVVGAVSARELETAILKYL